MSMRITQSMMATNVLNNLSNDLQSMQTAENQESTGLAVTLPSDNPLATSQIMSLNTSISMQGMYYSNMQSASSFLSTTDSALSDTVSSLQQVQSLVTEGANGTENAGDMSTIGQQVNQVIGQLVQTGNTMNGSQYVFGGTQTTTPPLATTTDASGDITAVTYQGNSGQINYEVAQGVQMTVNTNGNDLFQTTGSTTTGNTTMFNTLIGIKDDLTNDDTTDLSSSLTQLTDIITNGYSRRPGRPPEFGHDQEPERQYCDDHYPFQPAGRGYGSGLGGFQREIECLPGGPGSCRQDDHAHAGGLPERLRLKQEEARASPSAAGFLGCGPGGAP